MNIKSMLGLTYYISELDKFLTEYDHTSPKLSPYQRSEIEKYERIFALRDHPSSSPPKKSSFWDKF